MQYLFFSKQNTNKANVSNIFDVFVWRMYYSALNGANQIVITRVALENHPKYFTISYILAFHKDKEKNNYIFNKINLNIKN